MPREIPIPSSMERRLGALSFRAYGTVQFASCVLLAAASGICGANRLYSQAPANSSSGAASATRASSGIAPKAPAHARPRAVRSSKPEPSPATPAPLVPAPVAPVAPPPPNWPINDKPVAARVVWDSQGLRIDADNSSLTQILKDVSTDTGAKVEGLNADQRVFGEYGPGPARQVLSELLDGAGYNVLMFGDQGEGTPQEIVLSAPPAGPAPANGNRNNLATEEDYEPESPEPPPVPEPVPSPYQPPTFGPPPRIPQQIYQQQQRQQQMQQQNGPPQNQPNNPQ